MVRRPLAEAAPRTVLCWLVDDTADHHHVADATVEALAGVALEHFYTGAEAVETYRLRVQGRGLLPDVVLMDFYLAGERGDLVTRQLRAIEPSRHRPVIIGYSSVPSGSRSIVEAGGDLSLRKVATGMSNPFLSEYLRGFIASRGGPPV